MQGFSNKITIKQGNIMCAMKKDYKCTDEVQWCENRTLKKQSNINRYIIITQRQ